MRVLHRAAVSVVVLFSLQLVSCTAREPAPTAPQSLSGTSALRVSGFERARAAQERASEQLFAVPGVAGTGIGRDASGRAVVQVFLERPGVSGLPHALAGVPVVVEVTGPFRPFALADRERPVPVGVSLGNDLECIPGTVGAIVMRNGTRYLLGPNHLLARRNAGQPGESIVQPARVDFTADCTPSPRANVIARLTEFVPLRFDGSDNAMDAALAVLLVDVTCATPPGFYGAPAALPADPTDGLPVMKLGRTTGLTTAEIKSVNVKLQLTYPEGKARLVGQMLTGKSFGGFGDSGALVVAADGTLRPVGMLIGGGSNGVGVVTPIGPLLAQFGVTLCAP
jgi:hypothetical protein